MKGRVLKFETEGEDVIYVELDEKGDKNGIINAETRFEKTLKPIKRISNAIVSKVNELQEIPDEVNVEVGLKFDEKAGMLIAKNADKGNIKLNITWKKKEESPMDEMLRLYYKEELTKKNFNV